MKKLCLFALIVILAAAVPALAQCSTNFTGTALNGLTYVGSAQSRRAYVAATGSTPALAQLFTSDSGLKRRFAGGFRSRSRWATSAPSAQATIFTALAEVADIRRTGFCGKYRWRHEPKRSE